MFIHYRTQGLILKKEDRGEADQLFTIFTKEFGKLEILGKSIRKISSKLKAGMEIFYLTEVEFIQGRNQKILTDAILIEKFKIIRKDEKRLEIACRIAEVLANLIKGQETDEKIWQILEKTFYKLNSLKIKNEQLEILYFYFFWKFFSYLGYEPEVYRCLVCQKRLTPEEQLYFSLEGIICNFCKTLKSKKNLLLEVTPETIKILRIILKNNFEFLFKIKIDPKDIFLLKKISNFYYLNILKQ